MNKYITAKKRTIWTVGKDKRQAEAISMANEKFKTKTDRLDACEAWEKGDELFFEPKRGAREVWAVFTKGGI